jgi:dipeptidyl-peptidase 4
MRFRIAWKMTAADLLLGAFFVSCVAAQAQAPGKTLTVDRIWSQPSLSGRPLRGLVWSPDGKRLSYFQTTGMGRNAATELRVMDAGTGESSVLVSAEKLASVLPQDRSQPTQATGLGRRAPASYQWAPRGEAVLFEGPTSLAWYDLKTQTARSLVSGKDAIADAKISPDGRWVSFVRDHNLWLANVANGELRAFTRGGSEELRKGELDWVYPEELDIRTAYWWAPDSSAIAYLEMDERGVTLYPIQDFTSYTGETQRMRYPKAGDANPVVRVFVAGLMGGAPRAMDTGTQADIYIPRVDWLRDAKRLAIQRLNRAQNSLELLLADAATGRSSVLLAEKDPYWINVSDDLHFLADGKRFLWSSERSGYRHLYLYSLDGKELAQLTRGDWEVVRLDGVDEAHDVVYFTATEKSPLERHLYRAGLDGSGFARISREDGTHGVSFAPDARTFVDSYSNSMSPPRQDLFHTDGSRVADLNENKVAELADYHLSPVEFFNVTARDGAKLNAMMIKPPDFNPARKYPVIVYTYGGPHAQVVLNSWGGNNFLWHQLMAQKGFIIFALDNRGSAARGHAFESTIFRDMGARELSDQRDGVAYLRSQSFVDGSRIGVWGWSYGGYMTLNLMFRAGDDFKVGFSGAPVTDWRQYDTIYTERYMSRPQDNAEGYKEGAPINHAEGLKGKLMIAHGTGDDNVHVANTLSLINQLIEAGKYVEVAFFPGRGHPISDPPARKVLFRRVTQFFLDNL